MQITPDFSEASESSPIPAGVYKARITACEQKTSQRSGNAYLNWKLTIFGADGELKRQNNRLLFLATVLNGPGAGRLMDLYKAATGAKPSGPFDTDELIGKEVEVVVVERIDATTGQPSNFPDVKTVRATRG
jgi:hypothetical protein